MSILARLLLLAVLPALVGRWCGCAEGEVVSVTDAEAAGAVGAAGAAGPEFGRSATRVLAPLGSDVELECRVRRLGDKAVSWVRSRDLQILSHAGVVFTADARVSARASRAGALSTHALLITRLRRSDAGRYECQLNTDPKMSLFYNLTVLDEPMPMAVISAVGERELHAAPGGAITLACDARYDPPPGDLPLPPLDIHWVKDGQPVNLQSGRGGVSLDTERWAWRAVSRLTLSQLRGADAGRYCCAAAGVEDRILLQVSAESAMEAMQRDQSAENSAPSYLQLSAAALALSALLLQALYNT